ncbi:MAG: tetratricopeptide repeat protein, partial [Candidatus Paceibacteria bacterium]
MVECQPHDYGAWCNRGLALMGLDCYNQALKSFNYILNHKPYDWNAYYNRGVALAYLKHYKEAINSYNQALAINSDDIYALINRGANLDNLGNYEEAIDSFNQVLAIGSDDTYANALALINRGVTLNNLGRYEEALKDHKYAVKLQPNFSLAWDNLGTTLQYLGYYEKALEKFNCAVKLKRNSYNIWYNRGVILGRLAYYEEAVSNIDFALAIKWDFYKIWSQRSKLVYNVVESFYSVSQTLPLTMQTPDLDQRGYLGAVATLNEGFKYIPQQSEGWAKLHHQLGWFHFQEGRFVLFSKTRYEPYFWKAKEEFNQALEVLTEQDYPQARLEVLSDYIRVLYALEQPEQVEGLRVQGANLLEKLLNSPERSDWQKRQLALKFNNFRQLTVQQYVQQQQLTDALITAEKDKNACLQW